jgi:hypothetical protein
LILTLSLPGSKSRPGSPDSRELRMLSLFIQFMTKAVLKLYLRSLENRIRGQFDRNLSHKIDAVLFLLDK